MTIHTLIGAYNSAQQVVRILHRTHLAQQLRSIVNNPDTTTLGDLALALEQLDTHLQVIRTTEINVGSIELK